MSAAQACGDPFCQCGCGAWLGQCCARRWSRSYLMPALSDIEEPNPAYSAPPMNDQADPETTETLAPPTDREAKTNPENEAPEPRQAIAPPGMGAVLSPYANKPDWWEGSFFQSIFNDVQGATEANRKVAAGQDEILAAIQQADKNNRSGWETTQAQIASFRAELVSHDAELKAMRAEIESLKTQLTEQAEAQIKQAETIALLEKRLDEKQANAARPPAPATPAV